MRIELAGEKATIMYVILVNSPNSNNKVLILVFDEFSDFSLGAHDYFSDSLVESGQCLFFPYCYFSFSICGH